MQPSLINRLIRFPDWFRGKARVAMLKLGGAHVGKCATERERGDHGHTLKREDPRLHGIGVSTKPLSQISVSS